MNQVLKSRKGYKLVKGLFGKKIKIPEEWELTELQHHAELYVPMRDKPKKFDGNIPWLRIEDLDDKYASDSKSNQRVSLKTIKEMKLRVYPIGTVLCSCSATIGICAITTQKLTTNQTFIGITPNNSLDNQFLYYFLTTQKNYLNSVGSGSTILYISRKKFEKMKIIFPSLKEQQKIASILSNVDNLITNTKKIINQTTSLKKGIMQKLLTKGIGHIKFKKVKWLFGKEIEIPEEWELSEFGTFTTIQSGEYFPFNEFSEKGIAVLKIDNIMHGKVDWNTKTFLDKKYLNSHKEIVLNQGDIVLALNRPITHNQVKVAKLDLEDIPSILYQRVGRFLFKRNTIDKDFFYVFLNSPLFKKILSGILIGSDQPYVRTTELLTKSIPLPPLPEQQKLASILSNVDSQITSQTQYKEKLERLKKSLMQKLLTGEVRVTV